MRAVLDHIGVAVKDLEAALGFYRDALGLEVEATEEVASQRVRAHFIPVGEAKLELLEATAADSPIAKYVEKRGAGLHHITLRVDDVAAALEQLKTRGARLIDERPRPGAEGALVAFIHPSSAHGVLVELKQSASSPEPAPRDGQEIRRFNVGELEVISLHDGFIRREGGGLFGMVPRPVWSEAFAPDNRNRVRVALRPIAVRGVRTMLIDAGMGDKGHEHVNREFAPERSRNLDHALAAAGLSPQDIDIVLATHLHFDHAGGFTLRDDGGRVRPRFPRARYVVRRGEWEAATHPNERTGPGYIVDDFLPLADAGVLEMVDDDQTIMPGVRVRATGGHTAHHQIVQIESHGQHAVYAGDLAPTAAHLDLSWGMGSDVSPLDTLGAKKQLLQESAERRALVLLAHDPAIAAGYITSADGRFRFSPA